MLNKKILKCDLCVVGGGMAGLTAAISAAREGLDVVLMHERPVLGGNASSEIRMWVCGAKGKDNRETGILEEIALENFYRNPTKSYAIWDTVLYDFVRREKNITLLLNCTCMDASVQKGDFAYGRNTRIQTITGYQMTTQCFYEVEAKFFCDSSGDSILAPLCGAEYRLGREDETSSDTGETMTLRDTMTMGMSCLPYGRETDQRIEFIAPEWSTKLTEKDFENRMPDIYDDTENFWYLELGGDRDSIADTETLRDELIPLALGTWDYIKNTGTLFFAIPRTVLQKRGKPVFCRPQYQHDPHCYEQHSRYGHLCPFRRGSRQGSFPCNKECLHTTKPCLSFPMTPML